MGWGGVGCRWVVVDRIVTYYGMVGKGIECIAWIYLIWLSS